MNEDERRAEIREIMQRLEELREATQKQMLETAGLRDRLAGLERPANQWAEQERRPPTPKGDIGGE